MSGTPERGVRQPQPSEQGPGLGVGWAGRDAGQHPAALASWSVLTLAV